MNAVELPVILFLEKKAKNVFWGFEKWFYIDFGAHSEKN